MKEIFETKTIQQLVGFEAMDGRRFSSKEECMKYEKSAEYVLNSDLKAIMVGEPFSEFSIWEDYGCGSDDFMMAVLDIRNVDCLEIANRYFARYTSNPIEQLDSSVIGERVLVNLGYTYDRNVNPMPRTMNSLVKDFIKNANKYYGEEYSLPVNIDTLDIIVKEAIGDYESGASDPEDLVNALKKVRTLIRVKKG